MANPDSSSSRSDSDLFEDVEVIFEKSIDLSTADDKIIKRYINYKFQVYRENNIQDTTLRNLIKQELSVFTEDHWEKLDDVTFDVITEYCLTHGFWINLTDESHFKSLAMTKAINKIVKYGVVG